MIGTPKQIKYAKAILAGAKAYFESPYVIPTSGVVVRNDMSGSQLAAIAVIEALERGDIEEAKRLCSNKDCTPAGWLELVLDFKSGPIPQVHAGRLINMDFLRRAFYWAKDKGLFEDKENS